MRVSMSADGMNFRRRCTLVGTINLDGMVEFKIDPHTIVSGVGTTVETATRGLSG